VPLTFANRIYRCSAELVSPASCVNARSTTASRRSEGTARASAASARVMPAVDVRTGQQASPGGRGGRLIRPPEALLRSCRLLVSKEINERLRRSTGSGALQPRVESGTPPKGKVTWGNQRLRTAKRRTARKRSKNEPDNMRQRAAKGKRGRARPRAGHFCTVCQRSTTCRAGSMPGLRRRAASKWASASVCRPGIFMSAIPRSFCASA